jgi:hypothetical protein
MMASLTAQGARGRVGSQASSRHSYGPPSGVLAPLLPWQGRLC